MKLSEKRIQFTELTSHLSLWLMSEGIKHCYDWCKRDVQTQTALVNAGLSQTVKSKHLSALAMDFLLFNESGDYIHDGNHAYYKMFGTRAKELGLIWGGDWTFNDAGHIEWSDV